MRDVLRGVRAVQGDKVDPNVVQLLAWATYTSKDPEAKTALLESRAILGQLDPETSNDPETLGLWGEIHKRLYEMKDLSGRDNVEALTAAISAHQRGFYLKNDYYNGINFAFLLAASRAPKIENASVTHRAISARLLSTSAVLDHRDCRSAVSANAVI